MRHLPLCIASLALLSACAPALDWRDVVPAVPGLRVLLPCKVAQETREQTLAGVRRPMSVWACEADGVQWAIAAVAATDAGEAGRLEQALGDTLWEALGAQPAPAGRPWPLRGLQAPAQAMRQDGIGRRRDGTGLRVSVLTAHAGVWAWRISAWKPAPKGPDPGWEGAVQTLYEGLSLSATPPGSGSMPDTGAR